MKRFSFLISVVLSGSLLLAGCGGNAAGSSSGPAQGTDTVVVAMDPNSEPAAGFDPAFGWGAGEHVHEPLIQSTLTVTNADLTIGYDLATGYTVSEDGLTWTVTIRDGASFTDGEPLTAEDVAFTYNTVKNSSSVNDFTMLDYAEAADETTVVFHMTRPFSIWPYTMAIVGILPEHAYDPAAYGSNPIGSGRYTLVQWDRGQQVILEANPDYYGDAPNMRRVVVLFMEEDAAFLAAQAGQVDVAYTSAAYSDQTIGGYSLAAYDSVDNRGFNLPAVPAGTDSQGRAVGNDFTADVRVRRAINLGVDRQEMIGHVLNGYGSPAYSVCDGLPWYNEASEVAYDPEGAAALLEEAGWLLSGDGYRYKDGVRAQLNLLYSTGDSVRQALCADFANQMEELGIACTLEGVGWDTAYDRALPWSSITSTTPSGTPVRPNTAPTSTPRWIPTWTPPWPAPIWRSPTSSGSWPSGTGPPASPRRGTCPGCGWSMWTTSTGCGTGFRSQSRKFIPTGTGGLLSTTWISGAGLDWIVRGRFRRLRAASFFLDAQKEAKEAPGGSSG